MVPWHELPVVATAISTVCHGNPRVDVVTVTACHQKTQNNVHPCPSGDKKHSGFWVSRLSLCRSQSCEVKRYRDITKCKESPPYGLGCAVLEYHCVRSSRVKLPLQLCPGPSTLRLLTHAVNFLCYLTTRQLVNAQSLSLMCALQPVRMGSAGRYSHTVRETANYCYAFNPSPLHPPYNPPYKTGPAAQNSWLIRWWKTMMSSFT